MHELMAWALLFLLSGFDVSLFATRINTTIRICNALYNMSHMITFHIVHVVWLYSNWEGELLSKRISSRLWYISLKTNGWNKTHRRGIIVKTWLLNRQYNLRVGLPMFTTLNCDYKCRYLEAWYLTFTLICRSNVHVDRILWGYFCGVLNISKVSGSKM